MMTNEELSEKVKALSEEAVAMAADVFEIRLSYQKEDMDLLEKRKLWPLVSIVKWMKCVLLMVC